MVSLSSPLTHVLYKHVSLGLQDGVDFNAVAREPIPRGSLLLLEHVMVLPSDLLLQAIRHTPILTRRLYPREPPAAGFANDAEESSFFKRKIQCNQFGCPSTTTYGNTSAGQGSATAVDSAGNTIVAGASTPASASTFSTSTLGLAISVFNHSCKPNAVVGGDDCAWFDVLQLPQASPATTTAAAGHGNSGSTTTTRAHSKATTKANFLAVYSVSDIRAGEEICISYDTDCGHGDTPSGRQSIKQYGFECGCGLNDASGREEVQYDVQSTAQMMLLPWYPRVRDMVRRYCCNTSEATATTAAESSGAGGAAATGAAGGVVTPGEDDAYLLRIIATAMLREGLYPRFAQVLPLMQLPSPQAANAPADRTVAESSSSSSADARLPLTDRLLLALVACTSAGPDAGNGAGSMDEDAKDRMRELIITVAAMVALGRAGSATAAGSSGGSSGSLRIEI